MLEHSSLETANIKIVPQQPNVAAEIIGVDIAMNLEQKTLLQVKELWLQYPVLIFRKQCITDAQQINFANNFGPLEIHPSVSHRSSTHPEIYRVSNVGEDNKIMKAESVSWQYLELTWLWHTDSSFRKVPSMGSILHGIEIPPSGGETLFADMTRAFEALPKKEQNQIQHFQVFHSHDYIISRSKWLSKQSRKGSYEHLPKVKHPLVRVHPETDKKSLFLSPHTMEGIEGFSEKEGRNLLEYLISHSTQKQFVYKHKWQVDDILMWDNRCTMHAVLPYKSGTERRIMHRTTIAGESRP
tara:strand:+ start:293 stop:1186 length:894 start_codon:yes stop_codon:yes gene_type:complete